MPKPTLQFSFGLVIIIAFFVSYAVLQIFAHRFPTAVVQIGEKKIYVQVANTIGRQYTGLGGRKELLPYGGMVFPYAPARTAGIVMRDMQFPIDIIWVYSGTIVDIAPDVPTELGATEAQLRVYYPRLPGDMVIEVAAGFTTQYGIQIGDPVRVIDE